MTGLIKKMFHREDGAVLIVEAAFVFPIMFIILFFLIYMGNAHFIKAQVESIVVESAIDGANYCADPILEYIEANNGRFPNVKSVDVKPYRYLFGGMDDIEKQISNRVMSRIQSSTSSFFANMQPKIKTPKSNIAKYNNYILYSTFSVDVKYELEFPIRYFGERTPRILVISSRSEIAVNDATEFIRNTDMVVDYFTGTGIGDKIATTFNKINEFLTGFASK